MTLLSVYQSASMYPRLIFVRRLMRSPCCLCVCVPPNVLCIMRSPTSLYVCVFLLNIFVFYAIHVVSMERRRFVLPRTSCWKLVLKGDAVKR
jgi:hypothetical protein